MIAVHYFSLSALLLAYPALLMSAIVHGTLFSIMLRQVVIATLLGVAYWWKAGKLPMERVHPLAFIPMALIVPVIYALLTPLALFTLDSGSWETRGHDEATPDEAPGVRVDGVAEPMSAASSGVAAAATAAASVAVAASSVASATGRFELPAA
jgi:hypothetical protein